MTYEARLTWEDGSAVRWTLLRGSADRLDAVAQGQADNALDALVAAQEARDRDLEWWEGFVPEGWAVLDGPRPPSSDMIGISPDPDTLRHPHSTVVLTRQYCEAMARRTAVTPQPAAYMLNGGDRVVLAYYADQPVRVVEAPSLAEALVIGGDLADGHPDELIPELLRVPALHFNSHVLTCELTGNARVNVTLTLRNRNGFILLPSWSATEDTPSLAKLAALRELHRRGIPARDACSLVLGA